ncbi:hypothetical protein CABS01_06380 [Colletotrichum abscissum]|uniref:Uncharacterized protein n=1 Tax=Colletotrichum abscissum TaxID=1671311 RepID=A0A9P9XEV1_9PEZI|nr:uncharacterized protein CABS01_06380 [Colletotrichum abscissum]KAI3552862.1 hypothetical protein CABS02_06867 [Colletotrichum abscissum]KAK1516413.1 hypothetical protein CABS01_06380 [Colletotrichum abscissum]
MSSPESTSEKGVWDNMQDLILENQRPDIWWVHGRDEQDLQWVGDNEVRLYHASREVSGPLWSQILASREIAAWEQVRKSCIVLIDCDMDSDLLWDKYHLSELSVLCRRLAGQKRREFAQKKPFGSLVFFMGGSEHHPERREAESGIVALTMMTSLIYQILERYARQCCSDEGGKVLAFESAKKDDVEYLCRFFRDLVRKVSLEVELTCFIDFIGRHDTEDGMDIVTENLIGLVEDQANLEKERSPKRQAFKLVFTGPGPRGGLQIHNLLYEKRHIAASYYVKLPVVTDEDRSFSMT